MGAWLWLGGAAQGQTLLDGRPPSIARVNQVVTEAMTEERIPGLGIALIDDGRVVLARTYGKRDLQRDLPLRGDTVMYAASLTKATFAYLVLQLAGEGRIDLDRPIAVYLSKPLPEFPDYADLAGDERWRQLTLRMLLNHTTGFANFRFFEPDRKLRFHRDPGTRYGYSGEGFLLAQFVLEQGLGLDVTAEMQRRVFDRFGMTRSALTWRPRFETNYASGYTLEGTLEPHRRWREAGAAGSLDTTLEDWARFLAGVSRGVGLKSAMWREMISPQIAIDSPRQFPTLLDERTDHWSAIGLGYGLGWGVFDTAYGRAFFKEGHDEGTANYALCIAERQDCILLMANSPRAEAVFVALVKQLFGDVPLPAAWQGYADWP